MSPSPRTPALPHLELAFMALKFHQEHLYTPNVSAIEASPFPGLPNSCLSKSFMTASDFYLNPLVKISELIPLVFTLFKLNYLWPCKLSSSRESILEWKEKPCISYMIADDKWHRNTSTFTSYLWANWYILLLSENILANMVLYMSKFQIPCFLHVQEWIKHSIILLVVLIDAFSAQGSFLITIFHWNTLMSRN